MACTKACRIYAIVPSTLVEINAEKGLGSLDYSRVDCAIQYAEAGSGP